MYAGWLLTNWSGQLFGAHQKFNRTSRKHLGELLADPASFPSIKWIQHFEGRNGPDGMKQKSPKDEPRHFYDPFDPTYTDLLIDLRNHYKQLVSALKQKNEERAAYEAAWLAHVVTDGLTPAHHYPYEKEFKEITGQENPSHADDKVVGIRIIRGDSSVQMVKKNWKFYGAKGLFMTHGLFELGVAAIIRPLKLAKARPTEYDLKTLKHIGLEEMFKREAREVALLGMYDRFYIRGWTPKLARDVREHLAPSISKLITLAWYSAATEAKG